LNKTYLDPSSKNPLRRDDVEQAFRIGPHMLEIELDDVYFLTGLSRRGAPILLSRHRETPQPTEAYVVEHCIPGSRLVGGRIMIKDVRDLALEIDSIHHHQIGG
jgi:hypothetical protein